MGLQRGRERPTLEPEKPSRKWDCFDLASVLILPSYCNEADTCTIISKSQLLSIYLLEKCDQEINHDYVLYKEVDSLKKWGQPCSWATEMSNFFIRIICTHCVAEKKIQRRRAHLLELSASIDTKKKNLEKKVTYSLQQPSIIQCFCNSKCLCAFRNIVEKFQRQCFWLILCCNHVIGFLKKHSTPPQPKFCQDSCGAEFQNLARNSLERNCNYVVFILSQSSLEKKMRNQVT